MLKCCKHQGACIYIGVRISFIHCTLLLYHVKTDRLKLLKDKVHYFYLVNLILFQPSSFQEMQHNTGKVSSHFVLMFLRKRQQNCTCFFMLLQIFVDVIFVKLPFSLR